jgi:hypothetical protein
MPTLEPQFRASEIEALANRFGYLDDARLLAAGAAARGWLSLHARGVQRGLLVEDDPQQAEGREQHRGWCHPASGRGLATSDEASRVSALLELTGVGVPTASVLLYFAFPIDYPVRDVRALESLGVKPRSQYSVSFWLQYRRACRELARHSGVSVRTLDKALWQHSEELAPRALSSGRVRVIMLDAS